MPLAPRMWAAALVVGALLAPASPASAASHWSLSSAGARGRSVASSAPASPTGVTATCVSTSSNTVTVTWSAITHATNYTVFQSTSSSGPFSSVVTVASTTWTSGALSGAPTTYYWKVLTTTGTNWASGQSTVTAGRTISTAGHCA